MEFRVLILKSAKSDLTDIYQYFQHKESVDFADKILDKLESRIRSLITLSNRGHVPPEFKRIHIEQYQEIYESSYRIIYEVRDKKVYVIAVLDSRRDLQGLLELRIL